MTGVAVFDASTIGYTNPSANTTGQLGGSEYSIVTASSNPTKLAHLLGSRLFAAPRPPVPSGLVAATRGGEFGRQPTAEYAQGQ